MTRMLPPAAPDAAATRLWIDSACDALAAHGWFVQSAAVSELLITRLQQELDALRRARALRPAGIGRERDYQRQRGIRGDWIHWLDGASPAQQRLLDFAEQLRVELNRRLFLALFEFEAHFALYPPGAGYRRHLDSFRGHANRLVSMVLYLNPAWQPGDGGELVIHVSGQPPRHHCIEPRAGTLVLMMSEEIVHEVLPARCDRISLAGWYRLNNSSATVVDPPR